MEIKNQGTISYNYNSSKSTMESVSNVHTIKLVLENDISVTKRALSSTYIPQGTAGYQLTIENTGTNTLYNTVVSDDLGGNGDMNYISGSATLISDDVLSSLAPTSTSPLEFSIGTLESGQTVFITYMVQIVSSRETESITNTVTVTANGGESTGPSVTSSSSATINLEEYAKLSISKSSSAETVSVGSPFDYIFTITNSGNCDANNVVLTDELNENFTINSISVAGDTTTIYSPDEYTFVDGVLTIPNQTGPQISVPSGETITLTINGTLN